MTSVMGRKGCAWKNCTRYFASHRWGNTRAAQDGWFVQRNGLVWCPEHVPEWVAKWRTNKSEGEQ